MRLVAWLCAGLVVLACKQGAPSSADPGIGLPGSGGSQPCGLQPACAASEICVQHPEEAAQGSGRSADGTCPQGQTPYVCEAGEAMCCAAYFASLDGNSFKCKPAPQACENDRSCACLTGLCGRYTRCRSIDAGLMYCSP